MSSASPISPSTPSASTGAPPHATSLSPLQVLEKMVVAAAAGDSAGLAYWYSYAEQNLLAKDFQEIQKLMDEVSPLELGSEGLKSILNSLMAKGGKVDLGASNSNIRQFLSKAIALAGSSVPPVPVPAAVSKMMSGESLSSKEIQEVFNWVSDMALKLIPPQNSMSSLSAKLATLRNLQSQKRDLQTQVTNNLLKVN